MQGAVQLSPRAGNLYIIPFRIALYQSFSSAALPQFAQRRSPFPSGLPQSPSDLTWISPRSHPRADKMALRQRLLRDLKEFQAKPYPNIILIPRETDITNACLILIPESADPIHITVDLPYDWPLSPPKIRCDSSVHHPNVFGGYICASVLKKGEGYTSAYALKGVAIQILSFFSSESLEQDLGGRINLKSYGGTYGHFRCMQCNFGTGNHHDPILQASRSTRVQRQSVPSTAEQLCVAIANTAIAPVVPAHVPNHAVPSRRTTEKTLAHLPNELLAQVCAHLDDEDLINFAKSWDRIGGSTGVVSAFNVLRNRELLCFVLKEDFNVTKLGIGVAVKRQGRKGFLESEFELLSLQAFSEFKVRKSIHGIHFTRWLPVALSARHYMAVKEELAGRLMALSDVANLQVRAPAEVIYHFMNDVIVKLIQVPGHRQAQDARTTLKHASEKAIESYYHLFHLLLCLTTEDKSVLRSANTTLQQFQDGNTSKSACPNLGHLLLAILIADIEITQTFMRSIIREATTRNVVWMLDTK